MKKIIILCMLLSSLYSEENKFLGIFTIDNYPIDNCKIIKIGSLYSMNTSGYYNQYRSLDSKGFLSEINDLNLRSDIEKKAIKNGYNAVLGYKFYVNGAFDTFKGSVKNKSVGFAIYSVIAQGTPVSIKCKGNKFW